MEGSFINNTKKTKPVILLVIDTLMDPPLQKAIMEGQAPALKFLLKMDCTFQM
jgi:hypothetical protein